jgi:hypothetical protein
VLDAFDETHGRLVRRRVFVCPEAIALEALRPWPELRTVLAVETIRVSAHLTGHAVGHRTAFRDGSAGIF